MNDVNISKIQLEISDTKDNFNLEDESLILLNKILSQTVKNTKKNCNKQINCLKRLSLDFNKKKLTPNKDKNKDKIKTSRKDNDNILSSYRPKKLTNIKIDMKLKNKNIQEKEQNLKIETKFNTMQRSNKKCKCKISSSCKITPFFLNTPEKNRIKTKNTHISQTKKNIINKSVKKMNFKITDPQTNYIQEMDKLYTGKIDKYNEIRKKYDNELFNLKSHTEGEDKDNLYNIIYNSLLKDKNEEIKELEKNTKDLKTKADMNYYKECELAEQNLIEEIKNEIIVFFHPKY